MLSLCQHLIIKIHENIQFSQSHTLYQVDYCAIISTLSFYWIWILVLSVKFGSNNDRILASEESTLIYKVYESERGCNCFVGRTWSSAARICWRSWHRTQCVAWIHGRGDRSGPSLSLRGKVSCTVDEDGHYWPDTEIQM